MKGSLAFSSLAEAARGLQTKAFTSVELTQLFLDRIARFDEKAHAYVALSAEAALHSARAADAQRASGMPLPPLHGLPIAIKDLCEIEGQITTAGSAAWKTRRSPASGTVIERLQAAGMIVLGKLHMAEFAFSGWGTNEHMGVPRNPWDWDGTHRVPGGSSSGSGVAVAAGLAPAAIGSDTGGSVRIPAALNGVTGLKPTYGLISLYGAVPLSTSMDSIGVLTHTAEDAGLLADALAGFDWRDPATRERPLLAIDPAARISMRNLRIGVMQPDQYAWPVADGIQQAADEAVRVFTAMGAKVEPAQLPFDFAETYRNWGVITAAEVYDFHGGYIENPDLPFDTWVRRRVIVGKAVGGGEYLAAQRHRQQAIARFREWMRSYDLILTPSVPLYACPLAEVDEAAMPLGTLTRWVNYVGSCALSLPSGFSKDGLPSGVQLVAAHWQESLLVQVGAAFQNETDWHRRTPAGLE